MDVSHSILYLYLLTQGQCSHQTEQYFVSTTSFHQVISMASSGVRENVYDLIQEHHDTCSVCHFPSHLRKPW